MSVRNSITCLDSPAADGDRTDSVWTVGELAADLHALGVQRGQDLLVNASLREIGWVYGGASVVIAALREAVGPDGTIVMATGTPDNSTTSRAYQERVAGLPPAQRAGFRAQMRPFIRDSTPTSAGALAEALRTTPGAIRSAHPQSSFAALGPRAAWLMDDHRVDCHLGEHSPLGRLYDADASVLLLGVGYESCTALHLGEYRYTQRPPEQAYSCVVLDASGERQWLTYRDVVLDDSEFEVIGNSLDGVIGPSRALVGYAESRLMRFRTVVDSATDWLRAHRK